MESLTKSTIILPIKYFRDDLKHFLLIQSHLFPLVNERSDQEQYVFFKINISHTINIGYQRKNDLLYLRDEVRKELLVFSNFSDDVPALIDENLRRVCLDDLFFYMLGKDLETFKKIYWVFLENVRVILDEIKVRVKEV